MPGLLVALGPRVAEPQQRDAFARALDVLGADGAYRTVARHATGFSIGCVVGSALGHSFFDDGEGVRAWVYGAVYAREGASLQVGAGREGGDAARVCRDYRQHGTAAVGELNGEFNLVLYDDATGRVLLANDRFAIRPWYVTTRGSVTVLSPEVKGVLPFLDGAPALDETVLVGFLAFNKIRLGDRTVMDGVEVLPAASLWTVELARGTTQRRRYWEFRYNDSMSREPVSAGKVDELIDCYRTVMALRAEVRSDRRVGISLSGGLDSRTMVGALSAEHRAAVRAYTFGLVESDEVQLAAQVAQVAGVPQTICALDADDFVDHARRITDVADELDIFVQGCQCKWLPEAAADVDVMMTGIDLDVTLGGIYLVPDVLEARNDDDVLSLLRGRNSVFSEEELAGLLGESLQTRVGSAAYDLARELVADLPQESAAAKYDLFVNRYSMRRIIMLRYALIRFFMETASPMYDYDFMDLILALPTLQRAGHRTFHPFINRLCPDLAGIPYQRTMLPASAPLKFWPRSVAIEKQREDLYLEIWRQTEGRVSVPYRRYYTNYDEWLRETPTWLALTDELLADPKAMVYELGLLQAGRVADLVREHREAARSRRQQVVCLMSLELFLRRFYR